MGLTKQVKVTIHINVNVSYTLPYCVVCRIRQALFPLLGNSYKDGDRAPAPVPEHCSQQLANVNLPDTHGGEGRAPRQQQFSTACE